MKIKPPNLSEAIKDASSEGRKIALDVKVIQTEFL